MAGGIFADLSNSWLYIAACCFILLVIFYWYSTWTFDTFRKQGVAGPRPWPLVGNLRDILVKDHSEWQLSYSKQFGKVYGMYLGRSPILVVGEPELIKDVMVRQFHCFTNRRGNQRSAPRPVDRTLFALADDYWKHVRSAVGPTFTSAKHKQMMPVIRSCANNLSKFIESRQGEVGDVKEMMAAYAMDVVAGTAFGLDVRSLENENNEFLHHAMKFFSFTAKMGFKDMVNLILSLVFKFTFSAPSTAYLEGVLKKSIGAEKSSSEQKNFAQICANQVVDIKTVPKDSLRKTEGKIWTTAGLLPDDVTSNAIAFLLAGYPTTAVLLLMFFYEIAAHNSIQEKLYKEILRVFDDGEMTYEKLKSVEYLDWCVDETLRMYCPVNRIDRECNIATTVGGVEVAVGTGIIFPTYAVHHDPELWPEPHVFRPERFSPDESRNRHPCAFLPFGFGQRNCIGMNLALLETKAAIAAIMLKYEIRSYKQETLAKPLTWQAGQFFSIPRDTIKLHFISRAV